MAVSIDAATLANRIAGAANDDAAAASLLAAATAQVEEYAPDAPEAVQNEAVVRFAGYLAQSDFGGFRRDEIGQKSAEYETNHAAIFRRCGAAGLLTRWKKRRGGVIG